MAQGTEKKQPTLFERLGGPRVILYGAVAMYVAYNIEHLANLYDAVVPDADALTNPKGDSSMYTMAKDWWWGTAEGSSPVATKNSFVMEMRRLGLWNETMNLSVDQALHEQGFEVVNDDGSVTRYELVEDAKKHITVRAIEGGERGTGPWLDKDGSWHGQNGDRPNGPISPEAYARSSAERIADGDYAYGTETDKKVGPNFNAEVKSAEEGILGHFRRYVYPEEPVDPTEFIKKAHGFTDASGRQWEMWVDDKGKPYFRQVAAGVVHPEYPSVDRTGKWSFEK